MYFDKKRKFLGSLIISVAFVLVLSNSAFGALTRKARKSVIKGNKLYHQGDFKGSVEQYEKAAEKDPESDLIFYNLGTGHYKNGDYPNAISNYLMSLLTEDEELKAKTHYNLGNTYYKNGIQFDNDNPNDLAKAIVNLEDSLKQYESALSIESDDDTRYNYEFVKEELERLKEKQKQQQQSQQNQQQNQQQQNQSQQQQAQSEQNQNQNSEEQQDQQSQQQTQGEDQQQAEDQQNQQAGADDSQGQQGDQQEEQQAANDPTNPSDEQQSSTFSNVEPVGEGELTKQEAKMLLDSFRQTEQPQGLLNFNKKRASSRGVIKDW